MAWLIYKILSEAGQGHLVLCIMAVFIWEVTRKVVIWISSPGVSKPAMTNVYDAAGDFKDLSVPEDPHFEMILDPTTGLHHSNPSEPYSYDSEHTTGTYLFFHPAYGPNTSRGPGGFDYAEYFQCKSRLWEMRIHMKFKHVPQNGEDFFFGIELDDYVPLSRATQQAQKMVVAGINQAVGGVFHSAGDNPAKTVGELESPVCVLPLWAFDQFIVTPEGEEPPKLWDPDFTSFGSKRYKRIASYAEEIQELRRNLRVGPTYTFAFWGTSRFLDVINWTVIGVPIVSPIDFGKFAGKPPVHVVLYTIDNSTEDEKDSRHLRSKKTYYFRGSVWSSCRRPSRERINALLGAVSTNEGNFAPNQNSLSTIQKNKSLRHQFERFVRRRFEDCTLRPKATT